MVHFLLCGELRAHLRIKDEQEALGFCLPQMTLHSESILGLKM